MAYNEKIGMRIDNLVSRWKNTERKKMFGGVCHLLKGNMFCGVHKEFLILRLGQDRAENAMKLPHVRPFDITGKPMKGWIMVTEDGFKTDDELRSWLNKAKNFVKALPAK